MDTTAFCLFLVPYTAAAIIVGWCLRGAIIPSRRIRASKEFNEYTTD